MNDEMIYLDYAANTPVDEEVLSEYIKATKEYFGNPNSTHFAGKIANDRIEKASNHILELFREHTNLSDNMDIIYTSGASESNNMAIKGIARSYRENGKHMITTFLEHSSVSGPLTNLKEMGYEVDVLPIRENGKIDIEELKKLMRKDTILISICYVDGELGTVQPINEVSKILEDYPNCFLHVDCTQAGGKIKLDLSTIDFITFAPHKFYGLNGFGALLKRKDAVIEPLIHGGASTTIYRSGTPVTAQIVAMEKALELSFENLEERFEYVKKINARLRNELKKYSLVQMNSFTDENPYILNLSVKGVKAVDFKEALEKYGVCISIKSACSVTLTPSRSVLAITHDRKRALSSWRISLSHFVTEEEIDRFIEAFDNCYKEIV